MIMDNTAVHRTLVTVQAESTTFSENLQGPPRLCDGQRFGLNRR